LFYDFFHDGEAQPGTARLRCYIGFESALQDAFGEALACIGNGQLHCSKLCSVRQARVGAPCADKYRRVRASGYSVVGIREQVVHDLADLGGVAPNMREVSVE